MRELGVTKIGGGARDCAVRLFFCWRPGVWRGFAVSSVLVSFLYCFFCRPLGCRLCIGLHVLRLGPCIFRAHRFLVVFSSWPLVHLSVLSTLLCFGVRASFACSVSFRIRAAHPLAVVSCTGSY